MKVVSCLGVTLGCGLAVLAGACGRTVEQACGALAVAECGHLRRCSEALLAASHGDLAACERAVAGACEAWPTLPDARLGTAEIDACAAAYGDHPCDALVLRAPPAECRFHGEATNGAACVAGAECQSAFCAQAAGEAEGRCSAVRELGEECSKGGSPCAPGLRCGAERRCVAPGREGDPCDALSPCHPLYWCEYGVCVAPAGEGEGCDPCAGGATCDALAGLVCQAGTCLPGDVSSLLTSGGPPCF